MDVLKKIIAGIRAIDKGLQFLFPWTTNPKLKPQIKEDELVGRWRTTDDGGLNMISGQALEFKHDGTGNYFSWSTTGPKPYEDQIAFHWERLDEKLIRIRVMEEGADWEIVDYELKPYRGAYETDYRQLTSPGFKSNAYFTEGFWRVIYPLFMVNKAQ